MKTKRLRWKRDPKETAIYDEPSDFYYLIRVKAITLLILVSLLVSYAILRLI